MIQRYDIAGQGGLTAFANGRYVLLSDHLAALRAEREKAIAIKAKLTTLDALLTHGEDCPAYDARQCNCGWTALELVQLEIDAIRHLLAPTGDDDDE